MIAAACFKNQTSSDRVWLALLLLQVVTLSSSVYDQAVMTAANQVCGGRVET